MIPEESAHLLRSRLGGAVRAEDARALVARMSEVSGAAGDSVLRRGAWGDALLFVVRGQLEVAVEVDGNQIRLATVEAGHWIGELQFIEPGPASATVTARTDFAALRLPNDALEPLLTEHPEAAASLIRALLVEMCDRLSKTSRGVVQQVTVHEFHVAEAQVRRGWLGGWLARLFGGGSP